jgi:hypothetical protein
LLLRTTAEERIFHAKAQSKKIKTPRKFFASLREIKNQLLPRGTMEEICGTSIFIHLCVLVVGQDPGQKGYI